MTKIKSRGRSTASSPISLRLTQEEKQLLQKAAKGMSLSTYIRSRLFGKNTEDIQILETERLSPQARQKLLAQILSELGNSSFAKSFEEIANAAKIGVLPLTPDVLSEIKQASAHIQEMRILLLKALGLKIKDQHDNQSKSTRRGASTRQSFNECARQ